MLFVEAIETQRCLDEGVLTSVADANIGSIFGIGFPAWTGGVVQYVEGYPGGVAGFVARADELAARYGARFAVPESLRARAARSACEAAPLRWVSGRSGHTGEVAQWVFGIVDRLGAIGVGLLILLENLIPPIPSEACCRWPGSGPAPGR